MARSRFAVRVRNVKSIADVDSQNNIQLIQRVLSHIAEVLARDLGQQKMVRSNRLSYESRKEKEDEEKDFSDTVSRGE